MSTKVYEGYRFPSSRLHDFIKAVKGKTVEIMADYAPMQSLRDAYRHALDKYSGAVDIGLLRELSRESGWAFWLKGNVVYACPYGMLSGSVVIERPLTEFVRSLDYVQMYHYWNNVDVDENVPPQEWEERGREWEQVLDLSPFYFQTFEVWSDSAMDVEILQDYREKHKEQSNGN